MSTARARRRMRRAEYPTTPTPLAMRLKKCHDEQWPPRRESPELAGKFLKRLARFVQKLRKLDSMACRPRAHWVSRGYSLGIRHTPQEEHP